MIALAARVAVLTIAVGALSAPAGPQPARAACTGFKIPAVRCSTVSVPENRTTGKGRMIALRVAVLPARLANPASDPVFFLAGGPGQAATDFLRTPEMGRHALGARRDLVFLDQRGTGGSNPLMCDFYKPEDYAHGAFAPFMPVARVRECRALLERQSDLAQYSTAASVEDLEDVRRALGYERMNLSGGSYGTRLAMEYVRAYPQRVRTVILHGPVPPSLRMPEGFGRAAQQALDGVLDECAATPACASAFPDLRSKSRKVFERLAQTPITTKLNGQAGDVRMTRDNVAEAIRYLTYSSRGASRVPLLLQRAYDGNFTGLANYLRDYRTPGTFEALYLSITCTEDVPFLSKEAAVQDEDTYLGSYRVREQQAGCAEWPRGVVPSWHGSFVRSTVPVLITTGLLDPVTPPSGGDLVAQTLPNSLHLKVPSGGHGLGGLHGLDCVVALERDFVERASVKGLRTDCLAGIVRPGFEM